MGGEFRRGGSVCVDRTSLTTAYNRAHYVSAVVGVLSLNDVPEHYVPTHLCKILMNAIWLAGLEAGGEKSKDSCGEGVWD